MACASSCRSDGLDRRAWTPRRGTHPPPGGSGPQAAWRSAMTWTDDRLEPVFLAVRAGVAARRHLTWAVAMANPGRALSAQEIADAAGLDPKAVATDRRYAVWAVLAAR